VKEISFAQRKSKAEKDDNKAKENLYVV